MARDSANRRVRSFRSWSRSSAPGRIYPDVSLSRVSPAVETLSSSRALYLKRSKAGAGIVPRFCRAKPRHSSFSLHALACMMNIFLARARAIRIVQLEPFILESGVGIWKKTRLTFVSYRSTRFRSSSLSLLSLSMDLFNC